MSEIVTGTAVVVSKVAIGAIVAPIVVAGGCAAVGYALVNAPFWKDIKQTEITFNTNNEFCSIESLQQDLLQRTERYCERLLQIPNANVPVTAHETLAGLMALRDSKLVAGVAEEQFSRQLQEILQQAQRVQQMSESQIEKLNQRTASLLEQSLNESHHRMHSFLVREFKSAMQETGWTVKDEAQSGKETALLATNRKGQSLAVHLDKNGIITTDMTGFADRSCETEIQKLHGALEKRGIHLNRQKEQPHYLFSGGVIINRVSKAEQILQNAEKQQAKSRQSRSAKIAPSTPSAERQERAKKGYVINHLRTLVR